MFNTIKDLFQSSTGEGIMLRVKSLLILIIPFAISKLCALATVCLAPQPVLDWVDSFFVVLFGIIHAWAWFRALHSAPTVPPTNPSNGTN